MEEKTTGGRTRQQVPSQSPIDDKATVPLVTTLEDILNNFEIESEKRGESARVGRKEKGGTPRTVVPELVEYEDIGVLVQLIEERPLLLLGKVLKAPLEDSAAVGERKNRGAGGQRSFYAEERTVAERLTIRTDEYRALELEP